MAEQVNHPKHYNNHLSGVEAIDVVRTMSFNLGSAFKYVYRRDEKEDAIKDLRKTLWYVRDERLCRENRKKRYKNQFLRWVIEFVYLICTRRAYYERYKYIDRIINCEPIDEVKDIYRLLHEAEREYFQTVELVLIEGKISLLIGKYKKSRK